jgi:hypothetical protein
MFTSLLPPQRQSAFAAEGFAAGDYSLRVTVIEALGLAARDASGTSDPYVLVTVGGSRQRTLPKDEQPTRAQPLRPLRARN